MLCYLASCKSDSHAIGCWLSITPRPKGDQKKSTVCKPKEQNLAQNVHDAQRVRMKNHVELYESYINSRHFSMTKESTAIRMSCFAAIHDFELCDL